MVGKFYNAIRKHIFKQMGDGTTYFPGRVQAVLDDRGLALKPRHYKLETFFNRRPAVNADVANDTADKDFEILGTNSTTALATLSTDGGVLLTTAGADNDQMIIAPHLDAGQTAWATTQWNTGKMPRFESLIKTGASIAAVTLWAGLKLTNTSVIATDNDQVFFRYSAAAGGNWFLVVSRGGTDVATDLGAIAAVAASTLYRLEIEVNENRLVTAYINGVKVAENLAALTDNVNLIPYIGVHANTGAAKTLTAKYESMSRLAA